MYVAVPPTAVTQATWSSSTKLALKKCIWLQYVVKHLLSGIRSIRRENRKHTHKKQKETCSTATLLLRPSKIPQNSNRRRPKELHLIQRLGSRCPWCPEIFLGRVFFHGMVKIVWREVRWIRWLAELHQSAYTWNCSKRLGADLRLFPSSRILFRASLGGLRSPVHEQWQLFPNFEQLTSAHCLTILKVLTPSPPQVLSPSKNTLTSHGLICANTFTNFVFCSYFHDLQTVYFRSMTALKAAS